MLTHGWCKISTQKQVKTHFLFFVFESPLWRILFQGNSRRSKTFLCNWPTITWIGSICIKQISELNNYFTKKDFKVAIKSCTQIVGKGRLYSWTSFIYKYKMLCSFIKGASGGCFVLINKCCYQQSTFTHNPDPRQSNLKRIEKFGNFIESTCWSFWST